MYRCRIQIRRRLLTHVLLLLTASTATASTVSAATTRPVRPWWEQYSALPADALPGDRLLAAYFADRTKQVADASLAEVQSAEDWAARRDEYRRQLSEMLGLWPQPPRTDLHATVTGTIDHPEFTVEKLHFQSRPGLYVTANLYVPKQRKEKLPAIVYVCGHAKVVEDGESLGNKTSYQHHPAWFARNGYVCLIIDTLQLGEIEGVHHGLYSQNRWWWLNRGYTPAGVEAWGVIRALDYLETRPEVDSSRFGITGRSGGGAYSWWAAALDDRIKVAVPVAGITDLQNHVVDGCVIGHCDCMFMVNTYRWDFAKVAALVSPRPLLLANSDKDSIFPIDGVERLHREVRRIYRLQGADDRLGLLVTEGPHKDTQDLQVPAFRWFNRWLKKDTDPIPLAAEKFFPPRQLKVFDRLPGDQLNTRIDESFVAKAAAPPVPESAEEWSDYRQQTLDALRQKTFAAWPADSAGVSLKLLKERKVDGLWLRTFELTTQPHVPLRLNVVSSSRAAQDLVVLNLVGENDWPEPAEGELTLRSLLPKSEQEDSASTERMLKKQPWAMAYLAVRGVGPTAWSGDEKRLINLRRRFTLLGETADGMRVWGVRQAVQRLRQLDGLKKSDVWLQAADRMAGIALFAGLFEPGVKRLDLWHLPPSLDQRKEGPDFLNVLKVCDVPAAVALAADGAKVRLYENDSSSAEKVWAYPFSVRSKLKWDDERIQVRALPE